MSPLEISKGLVNIINMKTILSFENIQSGEVKAGEEI